MPYESFVSFSRSLMPSGSFVSSSKCIFMKRSLPGIPAMTQTPSQQGDYYSIHSILSNLLAILLLILFSSSKFIPDKPVIGSTFCTPRPNRPHQPSRVFCVCSVAADTETDASVTLSISVVAGP